MGTQKEIAKLIINKKADYILALKGNQGKLHKQVKDWFENAKNNNFSGIKFSGIKYSYDEQLGSGHHRSKNRLTFPGDNFEG